MTKDQIFPFTLKSHDAVVKGRAVVLGKTLAMVYEGKGWPLPVKRIVAEACPVAVGVAALSGHVDLKVLAVHGDGAIRDLNVGVSGGHKYSAYVHYDSQVEQWGDNMPQLFGGGFLSFLSAGSSEARQHILRGVNIDEAALTDCVMNYWRMLGNREIALKTAVSADASIAACIAIEKPGDSEADEEDDERTALQKDSFWRDAVIAMAGVKDDDMLSNLPLALDKRLGGLHFKLGEPVKAKFWDYKQEAE